MSRTKRLILAYVNLWLSHSYQVNTCMKIVRKLLHIEARIVAAGGPVCGPSMSVRHIPFAIAANDAVWSGAEERAASVLYQA